MARQRLTVADPLALGSASSGARAKRQPDLHSSSGGPLKIQRIPGRLQRRHRACTTIAALGAARNRRRARPVRASRPRKKPSSSTIVCQGASQQKPGVLTGKVAGKRAREGFLCRQSGTGDRRGLCDRSPRRHPRGRVRTQRQDAQRGIEPQHRRQSRVVDNGAHARWSAARRLNSRASTTPTRRRRRSTTTC